MTRFRPFVIGAVFGAVGLAALPLAGVLPHRAGGPDPGGWYHWLSVRQSVTLRSLTTIPPPLDDPARARRAAGHYELVCAACHGSPAAPPARLAADLVPPPPPLNVIAGRWRPKARLFQTVRYGVRHTAMPAWPSPERPDEVWDMVAFLTVLPDLTDTDYRAMAGLGGNCAHCHGAAGEGRDGMPRLNILSPGYIAAALHGYRSGARDSGTMMAVARRLSDEDIAGYAAAFGREASVTLPPDDGSHGAMLALRGDPARDIPACLSCHETGDPELYPALVGQAAAYMRRQLHLFVPHEPGDTPVRTEGRAQIMVEAARELDQADIDAVVDWLAGAARSP